MGAGIARQCSGNRCLARWTVWIPHRGRGGAAGRANSKKDLLTGRIRVSVPFTPNRPDERTGPDGQPSPRALCRPHPARAHQPFSELTDATGTLGYWLPRLQSGCVWLGTMLPSRHLQSQALSGYSRS
jgi:hypothetical protein